MMTPRRVDVVDAVVVKNQDPNRPVLISNLHMQFINILLFYFAFLLSGCASSPTGGIQTDVIHTLRGTQIQITRISLPFSAPGHGNVQVAVKSVWATEPSSLGQHKNIRVHTDTYQVTELSRPWTAGIADLLVDEHSIWLSDGMTKLTGSGELFRINPNTNQTITVIEDAGSPFAVGDGMIWAYNLRTGVVSGIDPSDNQVHVQLVTTGSSGAGDFAFGEGDIWQYVRGDSVNSVRRIDPQSKKVVAEISVALHHTSDRLRFVAGAVWILGELEQTGNKFMPVAIRIDAASNLITATIPLERSLPVCALHASPKTPVLWDGGLWISTFCSDVHRIPGVLLKIDLQSNGITDEIILSTLKGHLGGQPVLAAGAGALWGFDGRSAIRFDFRHR